MTGKYAMQDLGRLPRSEKVSNRFTVLSSMCTALIDLYLRQRFCFEEMKIGSRRWGETGAEAR